MMISRLPLKKRCGLRNIIMLTVLHANYSLNLCFANSYLWAYKSLRATAWKASDGIQNVFNEVFWYLQSTTLVFDVIKAVRGKAFWQHHTALFGCVNIVKGHPVKILQAVGFFSWFGRLNLNFWKNDC